MLLERLEYSSENCPIAAALSVVGERWTLLILRESFYGLRRFEDLLSAVGCARNILGDRLGTLVKHGLLAKVSYREEGQRQRSEYRLTPKGVELFPVLLALMDWGDRWMRGKEGRPVLIKHRGCHASVHVSVCCTAGHDGLGAKDTYATAGKGARRLARKRKTPSVPMSS